MKKILSISLCLSLLLLSSGCSSTNDDNKIVVGATLVPGGEILEEIKPLVEEKGYDLEIKIFNDYILPNVALNDKEIDANLFQHEPFLNETVESKGFDIVAGEKLYVCPSILYSKNIESLDELKMGDKIAISNNPSAASKSLKYLEELNLITLGDNEIVSSKDIVDNPKQLEFVELDSAQIPPSLPDVAAGFVDTTFAVPAGLDASKEGLYTAPIDNTYANLLAYRSSDKDSDKIKILEEVLTSDECRDIINNKYEGIVIPVFE